MKIPSWNKLVTELNKIQMRKLYRLEGEAGPLLEHTEAAMDWLLSPKAEGIGKKLLKDAHRVHGKPVTIRAAAEHPLGCIYVPDHHYIFMNPEFVDHLTFKTVEGKEFNPSLEVVLAHELAHAGQAGLIETGQLVAELQGKFVEKLMRIADARKDTKAYQLTAKNTPYKSIAKQRIKSWMDEFAEISRKEFPSLIQHPDYQRFVEKYEVAAVTTENKIAKLQHGPYRAGYWDANISAEGETKQLAQFGEILEQAAEVEKKTGIAPLSHEPAKKLWQEYTKNGSEFQLTKPDHPLLAVHKDGGRN